MNRRILASGLVVLALMAAGCTSKQEPPPAPIRNPLVPQPTALEEITVPEPTSASLMVDARRSIAIVAADVVSVGRAPGRWTTPCSIQGATYRVTEVIGGSAPLGEINVAHKICLGQPLIDNRTVGLASAWFTPGRKVVLFLERDDSVVAQEGNWVSQYAVFDERDGVLPDSEALRAELKKAIPKGAGHGGGGGDPFH